MTDLVLLVDVDNTLLDNDKVRAALEAAAAVGGVRTTRFWEIYEEVRAELDVVNFPETLERFGRECDDAGCLRSASAVLNGFSFSECLYPGALRAIEHLKTMGRPVILSDGDQLFQRHKIRAAGLEAAVEGHVLVYVHKERETADIRRRYPAEHYVLFDDKPRIHAAMKAALGTRVTTVLLCQGKYARAPAPPGELQPDLTLDAIDDVRRLTAGALRGAAGPQAELRPKPSGRAS